MIRPIAYDITRLATRLLNQTPNGIDRIDSAFAQHFVDATRPASLGIMMTLLGPRAFSARATQDVIMGIANHWRENETSDHDESYRRVVAWLGDPTLKSSTLAYVAGRRAGRVLKVLRWLARHGLPLGRALPTTLPKHAVYLNVSQFPLWVESYFGWLRQRPDVKPVFFIHDLLPIEVPEYFRRSEYERHRRRLENLARFGAAAIVTTDVVRSALECHLDQLGRRDMPILVAPIPAAATFSRKQVLDPELLKHPYFVVCGTIEPRKNHLLLLQVWRELVRRDGKSAPKLVVIGQRGWENENVVDLLERCESIRTYVIEVSGFSTPSLKRLLDGARALLMPSFAEGYGLPVVEALAANVPVIASDLPVFREIGGDRITAISPINGEKWLDAIRSFASVEVADRGTDLAGRDRHRQPKWESYFSAIEGFLEAL
jgi:glycosyltransferase involved in cell wall biosynthesis